MAQFPPAIPYGVRAQSLGVFSDGNDHSAALAAGISALPAGSSIYFSAGTYVLNHFTISNSVRLYGDEKGSTILSQGDASQTNFITLAANSVAFEKMTIQATGTTANCVYIPTGTTDITFDQVKVTGALSMGVNAFSVSGLKVFRSEFSGNGVNQFNYTLETGQTCSDLEFDYSLFDGSGVSTPSVSLYIQMGTATVASLTDVKITNNVFKTITRATVESDCLVVSCAGTNANTFDRVVIADNTISSTNLATTSSCYGIELAGTVNAVVTGNAIESCAPAIVTENNVVSGLAPNNILIANNLIRPNTAQTGATGIYIIKGASVSVVGNVITAPGVSSYGISVSTPNVLVIGNSIFAVGVGIQVSSVGVIVQGNVLQGLSAGESGITTTGTLINVQIRNNIFYDLSYGINVSAGTFTNVALSGNTFYAVGSTWVGSKTAAGLIVFDDSVSTNFALSRPVIPGTYTVATLPAASAALLGAIAVVTDATTPTWGSALTGGGAVVCLALCQGTSGWTAA
jgi:hypothetical protein